MNLNFSRDSFCNGMVSSEVVGYSSTCFSLNGNSSVVGGMMQLVWLVISFYSE